MKQTCTRTFRKSGEKADPMLKLITLFKNSILKKYRGCHFKYNKSFFQVPV